jgi:hypothetical protein
MDKAGEEGLTTWIKESNGVIRPRLDHETTGYWLRKERVHSQILKTTGINLDAPLETLEQQFLLNNIQQVLIADKQTVDYTFRTKVEKLEQDFAQYQESVATLKENAENTVNLLTKYGSHAPSCKITAALETGRIKKAECNCGWDEIIKKFQ